uniref:Ran-binding protein 3-like n=1 Tax=Hirondellea gigas TaxID=1518452 RepID=A0A2P2I2Q2_9CRUS
MSTSTIHKQAADTNTAESTSESSSPSVTQSASAVAGNNCISSSSNGTEFDKDTTSTMSSSNNASAADSSSNNGSVATSNNPFSRGTNQASSWGASTDSSSDDHHHLHYSRPVLAPSKLGGFGCSSSSILAPSKLGSSTSSILAPSRLFGEAGGTSIPKIIHPAASHQSEVKFKLKPSILGSAVVSNPFSKVSGHMGDVDEDKSYIDNQKQTAELPSCSLPAAAQDSVNKNTTADSSTEVKSVVTQSSTSQGSFVTPTPPPSPPHSTTNINKPATDDADSSSGSKSVFGVFGNADAAQEKRPAASSSPNDPSTSSSNGIRSPAASSSAPSFIFGQNIRTRVTGAAEGESSTAEGAAGGGGAEPSDNIFTAAASTLATSSSSVSSQPLNGGPAKSLETSSRELAEKESREKRKFEEVEVLTGEETESNVLQMNCKVYNWVRGSWQERGRGLLRLNDWGTGGVEMHSRLVVRTQGTLTIMLNTNIWSEMSIERASNKSVRFTASDPDGSAKIYLVMGQPKDIELLYTSLEYRVSNSRHREERENKRCRTEDQPSSSTSI